MFGKVRSGHIRAAIGKLLFALTLGLSVSLELHFRVPSDHSLFALILGLSNSSGIKNAPFSFWVGKVTSGNKLGLPQFRVCSPII